MKLQKGRAVSVQFVFTTFFVFTSVVVGQLPACRNRAVNDVAFDINFNAGLQFENQVLNLFADVNWTITNPGGATLDGFAVHFVDNESKKNYTVPSPSIVPVDVCHSGRDHIWVITDDQSACDSQNAPECSQTVEVQNACLCPLPNCSLVYTNACRSVLELLGPQYDYHITVLPTTRRIRYPIVFDTEYEFSISPYERRSANLAPTTAAMSSVDGCDIITQDIRSSLAGLACINVYWTQAQSELYEVQVSKSDNGSAVTNVTTTTTTATSISICGLDFCQVYIAKVYSESQGSRFLHAESSHQTSISQLPLGIPIATITAAMTPETTVMSTESTTQELTICDTTPNACPQNLSCIANGESYDCQCTKGFTRNGDRCLDIDECTSYVCAPVATCTNTFGSFQCQCNPGYEGNGLTCADTNECKSSPCDTNGYCTNTDGSFMCACNDGYSGNGFTCVGQDPTPIAPTQTFSISPALEQTTQSASTSSEVTPSSIRHDPTPDATFSTPPTLGQMTQSASTRTEETNPSSTMEATTLGEMTPTEISICGKYTCSIHATCEPSENDESDSCVCKVGYSGNGTNCEDVDECNSNTHNCHMNAACNNTDGSFHCSCNEGYSGNGVICEDIDECSIGSFVCDQKATCINNPGSYQCRCQAGFTGDGRTCFDINPCENEPPVCDVDAVCLLSHGSTECVCKHGYAGDGQTCEDVDECTNATHNCHMNATCNNVQGSFVCSCKEGYSGNGVICDDVDECTSSPCDRNAVCKNTDGSFACTCNQGYQGNGFNCSNTICDAVTCVENAVCVVTDGSFSCICIEGFTGNSDYCQDVDECASSSTLCGDYATCINSPGSFECRCQAGYAGDGHTCEVAGCSVATQNIFGLTFPPVQAGLVSYSEEKCGSLHCPPVKDELGICIIDCESDSSDCDPGYLCCYNGCGRVCQKAIGNVGGEDISLASVHCNVLSEMSSENYPQYNTSTFALTNCNESIESLTSPPYTNYSNKLKKLQAWTSNFNQLSEEDVKGITDFLTGVVSLDVQFSTEEVSDVVEITSHLSQYYGQEKFEAINSPNDKQSLVKSVTTISRKLNYSATFNTLSKNLNVGVQDFTNFSSTFTYSAQFYRNPSAQTPFAPIQISIPAEAFVKARSSLSQSADVRAVSVGYRNSFMFPSEKTTSWVIASSLGDQSTSVDRITLNDPVQITNFEIQDQPGERIITEFKNELTKVECAYWDFDSGSWSTNGCSLVLGIPVSCKCNHLTNFAILVSKKEIPANFALSVVSYVGSGLSIISLLCTMLVICIVRRLRKKYPMQILANLCGCLAISLAFFVFGVGSATNANGCSVLTVFLHYFLLATWFWMAVYSFTVYRDVVQVFDSLGRSYKMWVACAISYLIPFIIVVLNAGITLRYIDRNMAGDPFLESSYRARNFCWLRHYSLYFGFLLPVGILLAFNIVVFCIVIPKITWRRKRIQSTLSKQGAKQGVIISLVMATTMGLSWIFGYLMLISDDTAYLIAMSWLFTILNAFQGVFIFFFTVVRTGELKRLFEEEVLNLTVDAKTSSTASTGASPLASPSATL